MSVLRFVVLALASSFAGAGIAAVGAEEFYKWTDAEGRVHYSNRGSTAEPAMRPDGEGWESVLEQRGEAGEFRERADAVINGLQLRMTRKHRDRDRAEADLLATQTEIQRTTGASPELATLRSREARQIAELRKLDVELGEIEIGIARARALKKESR
ncbi:MAG: DUF4124 domain-containing protein [Candidatus Binatia bacterium]